VEADDELSISIMFMMSYRQKESITQRYYIRNAT